jgi:hypothetical protein
MRLLNAELDLSVSEDSHGWHGLTERGDVLREGVRSTANGLTHAYSFKIPERPETMFCAVELGF